MVRKPTSTAIPCENIIGFPVTTLSRGACQGLLRDWLVGDRDQPKVFVCANPHSLHIARYDQKFRAALLDADILTPDGIGIVIGSRMLGGGIRDRITGHDVFEDTCKFLDQSGGSCFFLGSSKEVLEKIQERALRDYPRMRVVGAYSPPFRAEFSREENKAMIDAINETKPDVLWVGMTAPKQEKWISAHCDKLDTRFVGAIGAVFDFYAGTVKRSPPVFQRLGLEWLPRLLQEPGRLWRRNFVSNPSFLLQIILQKSGLSKYEIEPLKK